MLLTLQCGAAAAASVVLSLPHLLQFMTATEDVADEVKAKLAKMDPAQRHAAVKKAKVGRAGDVCTRMSCMFVGSWVRAQ
jgi:hypothetical protein